MWKKTTVDGKSCTDFYVSQDTDRDGIPDWSALIDGQPSAVLYPQDEDIDGDGTLNVLDPAPYDPSIQGSSDPKEIPAHLKIHRWEAALLQKRLFQEFGIIAIDSTDEHSAVLLKDLLFLLRNAFPRSLIQNLRNLRYIYAFVGHDGRTDIAAYHLQAKAVSVGGSTTYDGKKNTFQKTDILIALAHEIGHAFLLDRMSPEELRAVSETFGGWGPVFRHSDPLSFYAPVFFTHHPLLQPSTTEGRKYNLVSKYAMRGVHEWFADAFAATRLDKLGQAKLLGDHWKKRLVGFNYSNALNGFSAWLERRLRAPQRSKT